MGAFELAWVFHQFVCRNTGAEHSLWADIITSFHSWAPGSRKRKHLGRCDGVGGGGEELGVGGWKWKWGGGQAASARAPIEWPGVRGPAAL